MYLSRGYILRGQHVDPFSHCSIWLCYTASDLAWPTKKNKFESSTCTIKNVSDNENMNLMMPSFLWQGNMPNRASKIKRLLVRHDIHLPRASGQALSYTSVTISNNIFNKTHAITWHNTYAPVYNIPQQLRISTYLSPMILHVIKTFHGGHVIYPRVQSYFIQDCNPCIHSTEIAMAECIYFPARGGGKSGGGVIKRPWKSRKSLEM